MKFLKERFWLYLLATVVADALFFGLTNPADAGTTQLMIGFVLAVATIYWLARGFAGLLGLYSKVLKRQRRRLTKALTIGGAVLIGLQSMGQLSPRDVAVLLPLIVLAYFYVSYVRPGQRKA